MSWKVSAPLGLALASGLIGFAVLALIHEERTAPFASKPSIVLRALAGDTSVADLARVLDTEAERVRVLQEQRIRAQKAEEGQRGAHEALVGTYKDLERLIEDKQATEWSSLSVPTDR